MPQYDADIARRLKLSQQEFEKLTAEEVQALLEVYDDSLKSILYDFRVYASDEHFYTQKRRRSFLSNINRRLSRFEKQFTSHLTSSTEKAARLGWNDARRDLDRVSNAASRCDFGVVRARISDDVAEEAADYVNTQTRRMSKQAKQHVRALATDIVRNASVSKVSRTRAASEAQKDDPRFKFIDRAGRKWDAEKYFKLLAETTIQTARREAYVETCALEGHDLLLVSSHQAKDRCRPWEGRIISLSGKTEGYPTYSHMMSTGDIFHPRCRHFLTAISPPEE